MLSLREVGEVGGAVAWLELVGEALAEFAGCALVVPEVAPCAAFERQQLRLGDERHPQGVIGGIQPPVGFTPASRKGAGSARDRARALVGSIDENDLAEAVLLIAACLAGASEIMSEFKESGRDSRGAV